MSTRGFLGFVAKGREVITYNHSSSYPGGLGLNVLNWLRSANMDVAAKVAPNVRAVSDDVPPTDEDVEALASFYDRSVDRGRSDETGRPTWYQLTRGLQGDLGAMLCVGYALAFADYACGFPGCEYGYVVDFDAKRFEVYKGCQHERHSAGRFADRGPVFDGHFPCRLVASWPLAELPDEDGFIAQLEDSDEDDEEN